MKLNTCTKFEKKRANNCKILIMCTKCHVCTCYMYTVINKHVYCNKDR